MVHNFPPTNTHHHHHHHHHQHHQHLHHYHHHNTHNFYMNLSKLFNQNQSPRLPSHPSKQLLLKICQTAWLSSASSLRCWCWCWGACSAGDGDLPDSLAVVGIFFEVLGVMLIVTVIMIRWWWSTHSHNYNAAYFYLFKTQMCFSVKYEGCRPLSPLAPTDLWPNSHQSGSKAAGWCHFYPLIWPRSPIQITSSTVVLPIKWVQ